MSHFDQNFKKHQTTSNNSHSCRLQCTNCPRIPAKGFKLLILSKNTLHAILPQKITLTYSSYETPDKNSENSSANDARNMNVAALREQRSIECKENAKGRQWRNHPEKDRVETSLTLKETINKQSI